MIFNVFQYPKESHPASGTPGPSATAVTSSPPPVVIRDLRFSYPSGGEVLNIKEFTVASGERVFLHGPSGSGKTTLLGLISGVLGGAQGTLSVLGTDFIRIPGAKRDTFRGDHIGYIFQMFNLIPYLDVEGNVTLPVRMSPVRRARLGGRDPAAEAKRLCEALGIGALLGKKVTELSVGQQQRVAAARALMGAPELIIADEPTSALDSDHRGAFLELLFAQCAAQGATLLFVSHDRQLMPLFPRVVSLPDINAAAVRAAANPGGPA
jgi:putative ABC transport system ATP-binding protein